MCVLHTETELSMKMSKGNLFDDLSENEREEMKRRKELIVDYLIQKRRPEELIHEAGTLMQCPIMLTTNTYRVLVMDDLGFEVNDPIWRGAKKEGYCDADSVALFETEGITRRVMSQERAFVLDYGLGERIPRILHKIDVFGKIGAYIGIFQTGRPFNRVDLATADILCQVLSVMLERGPKTIDSKEEIRDSILYDLIEGRITEYAVLNDRIRWAAWTLKPIFRCVMITPSDRDADLDNGDYFSYLLTSQLPDSRILRVPEGLLLLMNYAQEDAFPALKRFLSETAEKYGLFFNVSGAFYDLMLIRAQYEMCLLIRNMAKHRRYAERLNCFDDSPLEVLAERITPRERRLFALPKYGILAAYDKRHATDYCRTMTTFIESGCSVTAASARLYIHRNTMNKRLNRIAEICGLEVLNGKELIHFYLTDKLTGGRGP